MGVVLVLSAFVVGDEDPVLFVPADAVPGSDGQIVPKSCTPEV